MHAPLNTVNKLLQQGFIAGERGQILLNILQKVEAMEAHNERHWLGGRG